MNRFEGLIITPDVYLDESMICGAVRVGLHARTARYVGVEPAGLFSDAASGSVIREFADAESNIRACTLDVMSDQTSPAWTITNAAGSAGYVELSRAVAGTGRFHRWRPAADGSLGVTTFRLPEPQGNPIEVRPGDTFQACADRLGLVVLATFPGAPFEDRFEELADTAALPQPVAAI